MVFLFPLTRLLSPGSPCSAAHGTARPCLVLHSWDRPAPGFTFPLPPRPCCTEQTRWTHGQPCRSGQRARPARRCGRCRFTDRQENRASAAEPASGAPGAQVGASSFWAPRSTGLNFSPLLGAGSTGSSRAATEGPFVRSSAAPALTASAPQEPTAPGASRTDFSPVGLAQ